jgi:RNA polymerase sigma-70 factor (ECF subfamily)
MPSARSSNATRGRSVPIAQRMLNDRGRAEDVVQETFLRLWSEADRFRPERARLTTWLHRIAHNLCIDVLRRESRLCP